MTTNIFCFVDTYWLQINSTAMGTQPVVTWAVIYYVIHEENTLLPHYNNNLSFYCCWIDNVLGVWKHHQNSFINNFRWQQFQRDCQYHSLVWYFVPFTNSIHFLDLQITFKNTKSFKTYIYKKQQIYTFICPCTPHTLQMYSMASLLASFSKSTT